MQPLGCTSNMQPLGCTSNMQPLGCTSNMQPLGCTSHFALPSPDQSAQARDPMNYRDGSLLCLWFFSIAACESTTDRIIPCPVIRGSDHAYGALIGTAAFAPGACIEVFDDGRRLAHTNASSSGTFSIQFGEREMRDDSIQLRVTGEGRRPVEYNVRVNDRQHAAITFEAGSAPIVARESGLVRLQGKLVDPVEPMRREAFTSPPISTAWVTNWRSGEVVPMVPTPVLSVPFDNTSVFGHPGDPVAPVTMHGAQNATGACYWPAGSGYGHRCTQEDWDRGRGTEGGSGTCTRRRGCEPLMVEEPERPAPFNQEPPIPQGPPVTNPYDAGPPDAGPPDAWIEDAWQPDADIDVGGPS